MPNTSRGGTSAKPQGMGGGRQAKGMGGGSSGPSPFSSLAGRSKASGSALGGGGGAKVAPMSQHVSVISQRPSICHASDCGSFKASLRGYPTQGGSGNTESGQGAGGVDAAGGGALVPIIPQRSQEELELRRAETALAKKKVMASINVHANSMSKKGVIDPRNSKWMHRWDLTTMLALVFTAIVTPYEVAFIPQADYVDSLFVINRTVDVIFCFDIMLQFFLMFPVRTGTATVWVSDRRVIAKHYIKGWFWLDVVSVGVSGFDIISLVMGNSDFSKFKVLRVLRVLRLIKLVRLVRASRIAKRFESQMAINYGTLSLWRSGLNVILLAHWLGCLWGLQAKIVHDTELETWIGDEGLCWANGTDPDDPSLPNVVCRDHWEIWAGSTYWAVATITSIGYGDIVAVNAKEQMIATLLMLIASLSWGNVIATFCGVVATINPEQTEFRRTMDDLNRFMRLQGLPAEMRTRLREYFHQTRHLQAAATQRSLFTMMSPQLLGEVAWAVNSRWLRKVWFLKKAEQPFLVQVAITLGAMVFAPGEVAGNGFLYIVHRGIALYGGKVLTSGKLWGEDMILMSQHLQSKFCARAMNYLEVYMISRDELVEVAKNFPDTYKQIRRSAILMALRREIVFQAKAEMGIEEDGSLTGSASATFDMYFHKAGVVTEAEQRTQNTIVGAKRSMEGILDKKLSEQKQRATSEADYDFEEEYVASSTGAKAGAPSAEPGTPERNSHGSNPKIAFKEEASQRGGTRRSEEEADEEGPSAAPSGFMKLSANVSQNAKNTPLKKMKSMRAVANHTVELKEILQEQKDHGTAIEHLTEAVDVLKAEQAGQFKVVTAELARLAALLQAVAPHLPQQAAGGSGGGAGGGQQNSAQDVT